MQRYQTYAVREKREKRFKSFLQPPCDLLATEDERDAVRVTLAPRDPGTSPGYENQHLTGHLNPAGWKQTTSV